MATHHEGLLDDVSLLVGVFPPPLGNDEGVVKEEHPPLLQYRLHCLLDRKNILRKKKEAFLALAGPDIEDSVEYCNGTTMNVLWSLKCFVTF